jgi:uncharacterized protein YjbJ (UPF0337 family)
MFTSSDFFITRLLMSSNFRTPQKNIPVQGKMREGFGKIINDQGEIAEGPEKITEGQGKIANGRRKIAEGHGKMAKDRGKMTTRCPSLPDPQAGGRRYRIVQKQEPLH